MHCPYLEKAEIFICSAKPGAMMSPNEYELNYYCLSSRYNDCPIYKKHHRAGRAMHHEGTE